MSRIKNHMTCYNIAYICIQSQDDLFSGVMLASSIMRYYLKTQYILKMRFSSINGGCICRYVFKILINPSFRGLLLGGCDFIFLISKLTKISKTLALVLLLFVAQMICFSQKFFKVAFFFFFVRVSLGK